jgi:hypothetical protein
MFKQTVSFMKNFLFAVCLIGIVFSFNSCKKDHAETSYYCKVKVDDQWITYGGAQFYLNTDPLDSTITDFQIYAGTLIENFNISIQSSTGINTGSYNSGDHMPAYRMFINAFKEVGAVQENYSTIGPGTGNEPAYTVTITSFSQSEIRGTIAGNYLWDDYDQKAMNVTAGEFVAKRVTQ